MRSITKVFWAGACWSLFTVGCGSADTGSDSGEMVEEIRAKRHDRVRGKPPQCSPSFAGVGQLSELNPFSVASDLSADGTTATGVAYLGEEGLHAFRYSGGVIEPLGPPPDAIESFGTGVSGDGSVIAGYGIFPGRVEPFLWRDGEFTMLGFLSGGDVAVAQDLSEDGKVVVGWAIPEEGLNQAFRWEARTGMVGLSTPDELPSEALATDRHGSNIVGDTGPFGDREATLWKRGGGVQELGVPSGFTESVATGLSRNGRVIVGTLLDGASQSFAARWTRQEGWEQLDSAPSSTAATNRDGSVVVGEREFRAVVWDEAHGARFVDDILSSAGIELDGWRLSAALDVSLDGRVIVGYGQNPLDQTEGWIACLP